MSSITSRRIRAFSSAVVWGHRRVPISVSSARARQSPVLKNFEVGYFDIRTFIYFKDYLLFYSEVANSIKLVYGCYPFCYLFKTIYQHWINVDFPEMVS